MCFCASEVDETVHPGPHNSLFQDISTVFFWGFFFFFNVEGFTVYKDR